MGFLTKEGLQNLTNKLVQGDAIKVASHRGKNVKEVIDNIQRECENVALPNTMTLENRVNEFKVGQGRDVDVSGDVEEGKIEVGLSGRTYQNLTGFGVDFQTQHSGVFEKMNDENSLLVKRVSSNDSGWAYWYNNKLKRTLIKPNTKYTLLFKFDSNKNHNLQVSLRDGSSRNPISNQISATRVFSNIYMVELTTVSSFNELGNGQVVYLHGGVPPKKGDWSRYYKDIILLEGDHTQTPLEELPRYFKGIKSSFEDGVVDVEVQGKNLFDGNYTLEMSDKRLTTSYIKVEPNTGYICLFNDVVFNRNSLMQYNSSKEQISYSAFPSFFVTSQDTHFVRLQWYNKKGSDLVITEDMIVKANIQLEKGKTSTPYEPYYKKKISFNIGESLRSLPNGVCDEIRNNNGQWELIRRVEKVVIDGTDYVVQDNPPSQNSTIAFAVKQGTHSNTDNAPILNDKFINVLGDKYWNEDKECLMSASGKHFKFRILRSKLETEDSAGFKKWLSQNPTTVYYQLAEPIITPIEPIEFNISQGAVINISSNISPASTHKVILNRAGQIEQGIELIANLKSRINDLENIYDSNLLATQYRLNNLKLNYELEREED